jgi:hypothetical protein
MAKLQLMLSQPGSLIDCGRSKMSTKVADSQPLLRYAGHFDDISLSPLSVSRLAVEIRRDR